MSSPAPDPVAGLLGGDEDLDPTAEQILDGAFAEITDHGLRRTSIDAIAHRAGVGRVTVFRKFGGRDHSTVIHAVRRIEELRGQDHEIDGAVKALIRPLEG